MKFEKNLKRIERTTQEVMDLWGQHVHSKGFSIPTREDGKGNIFAVMLTTMLQTADKMTTQSWDDAEDMIRLCFWGISEAVELFRRIHGD